MSHDATAIALAAALTAASAAGQAPAVFAAPVRLRAGDEFLGHGRLYPSPAVRDMDGDGLLDVVIGDLPGRVTVARRQQLDDGTLALQSEVPLKDRRGEALRFNNW